MRIGIASPFNPYEFKEYLGIKNIPSLNESARAIHIYVKELLEAGHSVTVFTTYTSSQFTQNLVLQKDNLKIFVISRHYNIPKIGAFVRLFFHKSIAREMEKEIDKLDVLHAQWTYEYALAASRFTRKLPVFCTVRDWCPVIMKGQNNWVDKIYWKCSYYTFKKVMANEQIHFIANSSYTLNQLRTSFPSKEINLIYNPIDKKDINETRLSYPSTPVFVSIANGNGKLKNISKLVEAFNEYHKINNNSKLLLIGGCFVKDDPVILEWGKRSLLNGVVLMGLCNHETIVRTLDGCSAMIHPSLEETFGNVLVEGMSRRIPVVGGDKSGAVPEVLDFGECGILCDVTDTKSIYNAMVESLNPTKRNSIVDKATKRLKEVYASNAIVKKHIDYYQRFLCS